MKLEVLPDGMNVGVNVDENEYEYEYEYEIEGWRGKKVDDRVMEGWLDDGEYIQLLHISLQ